MTIWIIETPTDVEIPFTFRILPGKVKTIGRAACHLKMSGRVPDIQPKATQTNVTTIIGSASSFIALKKLSKRSPRSRNSSLRRTCEPITSTNAKLTGIKTISFVRPAAAERIHSAMSADENTDAISQPARDRSLGLVKSA